METRTTAVGTKSSSDTLSAANYNDGAGGAIGYAQATANQTGITVPADLTSLTLTLTPNASRLIKISYCVTVASSVSNDNCKMVIFKDEATFDSKIFTVSSSAVDDSGTCTGYAIDVGPTNASHTYKLNFGRAGSSGGTWQTSASSTQPATLLIEDIGPSF